MAFDSLADETQKVIDMADQAEAKLEADIKFNEGIEQEFEGDFPDIEDYFETVKPYFLKVIGEE